MLRGVAEYLSNKHFNWVSQVIDGVSSRVFERSDSKKVLAGVFGGLGEYLNVDPNLLRLVGVILLIVSPALMIVLYTFAALLIPRRGGVSYVSPTVDMSRVGPVIVGLVLLLVGMWLMGTPPLFILGYPFLRITFATVAGLVIAVIGLVLLVDNLKKV